MSNATPATTIRELTDEALMIRLANQNDQSALRELMTRHTRQLTNLCRHILHDPDLSLEIVNQTFLRIWRHRSSFRPSARFIYWAHSICRRLALNEARRIRRQSVHLDTGHDHLTDASLVALSPINPADETCRRDEFQRILDLIGKLPSNYQKVFRLAASGLEPHEITQQLGIPNGTVKTWFHRGRAILNELRNHRQELVST